MKVDSARQRSVSVDLDAPLPVHPDVRVLKLDNGFTIWVAPRTSDPGNVSMWLHVGSGSLNEDEEQRGLAHFLEHLAFRGSANFPPGGVEESFEALGLRLGRDVNAFTTLHQTTYTVSLPDWDEQSLRLGLQCLSDFACRLELRPDEVGREREVILEEMRAQEGAEARVHDRVVELVLPGSRAARRSPLGLSEVVEGADSAVLFGYYRSWYRPDNSTLLVVGDVEEELVAALVSEYFASWAPVEDPLPDADLGIVAVPGVRAGVVTDPELTEAQVRVVSVWPMEISETVGDLRSRLVEELATWMVNRRLGRLVAGGKAPFREARTTVAPLLDVCTHAKAVAFGPPDRVDDLLASLTRELKRVRDHSFLDRELDAARSALLGAARQGVRSESCRKPDDVLREFNRAVLHGRFPISSHQRMDLAEALLPEIGGDEAQAGVVKRFSSSERLILAITPTASSDSQPIEDELVHLATGVEGEAVDPPTFAELPQRLLESEPDSGSVRRRSEDDELGIESVTLDNGIRLHLREMKEAAERVFLHLTLGGGRIREQPHNLGITMAAALVFSQPATSSMSSVEIRDVLAGMTFSIAGWVDEDTVSIKLAAAPEELEAGMQLIHLLLTRPRLEEALLELWRHRIERYGESRQVSVEAQLAEQALELLTGGDPRFRVITGQEAGSIHLEQAQGWLEEMVANAPIEVAIVGDLGRGQLLDLALRYLGSVTSRPVRAPDLDGLRGLSVQDGPLSSTVEVSTVTPRAAVLNGWRAAPWESAQERRLLLMAEQVLTQRLHREIRDQQGLTYSTECSYSPSKAFPNASMLAAAFYTAPERVEHAARSSRELIESFACEGPTVAEVEAARRHVARLFEDLHRKPQYWSRVLADLDFRGTELSELKTALEQYLACTRGDILTVLQKYVTEQRRIQVVCRPVVS